MKELNMKGRSKFGELHNLPQCINCQVGDEVQPLVSCMNSQPYINGQVGEEVPLCCNDLMLK